MPAISIIVPVYNTEQYICRCIDSILSQTFTDYELLLVDDGSTDSSGAICDDYAKQYSSIRVFHQANQGQSVARNTALNWLYDNSDSQFIAFADSDDWMHPKYLELLYRAICKYGAKLSQCKWQTTEGVIKEREITEETLLITPEEQYTRWYSPFPWGKLYDRSIFQNLRYPEGVIFEDVAIWYKILFSVDSVAIVNDELYYYFQRREGTVNAAWTPAKMAWVSAWDETLAFAEKYNNREVLKEAVKRACWVYKHEVEEIKVSDKLTDAERKRYSTKTIKRLRRVLCRHKKALQEQDLYNRYFAFAFPRLNKMYWTFIGILGKFKRRRA